MSNLQAHAPLRLLFDDGSRHTQLTGYGNLARSIITAFAEYTDLDLAVRDRRTSIPDWVTDRDVLEQVPVMEKGQHPDCILRISVPPRARIKESRPAVIYTQNGLGDLRHDWVETLSEFDHIIVPGEFDLHVFEQYFDSVSICHQHVDDRVFKQRDDWRSEGPDGFSFLFVGSFSYRKGVDLLLNAFSKAFDDGQPVTLTLHCFSGLQDKSLNLLLDWHRRLPPNITLRAFNGSVTPPWMNRYYNRHDCIVTFSRGEGWCMPAHEALLCGKPVIVTQATALGECLPNDGVMKVPTREKEISQISDPWGSGFKDAYGCAGNTMYEVDEEAAVSALREMYANYDRYQRRCPSARAQIVRRYSKSSLASKLNRTLQSVM